MSDIIRSIVNKKLLEPVLGGSGSSGGGSGIPQEDIDAAFAALAEKGVTVPDGATSADLDDLIASIVAGGGGGMWMQTGTVTLTSDETASSARMIIPVDDSEGVPQILYMCRVVESDSTAEVGDFLSGIAAPGYLPVVYMNFRPTSSKYNLPMTVPNEYAIYKYNGGYEIAKHTWLPYTCVYRAGVTYRWFAIGGIPS